MSVMTPQEAAEFDAYRARMHFKLMEMANAVMNLHNMSDRWWDDAMATLEADRKAVAFLTRAVRSRS